MSSGDFSPNRSWVGKFRDAFRGVFQGVYGQSSFAIHLPFAAAVVIAGAWFRISLNEWTLLTLSITLVLVAELLNSAMELMARAIDRSFNPLIGKSLDIASGAVLLAAVGAVVVGFIVFLPRLSVLFGSLAG